MTFDIERGEARRGRGPLGRGQDDALNMLGGMDACSSGTIALDGREISAFSEKTHVLPSLRYRVRLPVPQSRAEPRRLRTWSLPARSAGSARCGNRAQAGGPGPSPETTSRRSFSGEQQRVAIARALAKNLSSCLCDDPAGALDYPHGQGHPEAVAGHVLRHGQDGGAHHAQLAFTAIADRGDPHPRRTRCGRRSERGACSAEAIEW